MEPTTIKYKTEFLVSTKAELITEKVNKWIEEHPEYDVIDMIPFMSYTSIKDKGAMMIGCMIKYYVFETFETKEEESPRENNTEFNEEQ